MRRIAVLLAASGLLFGAAVLAHAGVKHAARTTSRLASTAAGTCAWCHAR